MSKWIAEFDLEDGDKMPEHMEVNFKGAKIDFYCRPKEPILDKTREEAIENLKILKEEYWDDDGYGHETKQYDDTMLALDMAIEALEQEPTTKNDLGVDKEERELALMYLEQIKEDYIEGVGYERHPLPEYYAIETAIKSLELPSVTPQEPRWIPMVRREPTDEEKADYLAQNGEELCYMLENEMPLNGQEVLVSIGEFVAEDVFDEDFYNFENNDIENVDAWMPKPEPYKESEEV